MATRLIDFPALWSSDKLFACAAETRCEYAWLYGLADAHGSFELTNLRVIHGRVAPIREDLTLEKLALCVKEFNEHGLLFIWQQDGKRYGHWTNSEGRLPSPGHRSRYARFAPAVPEKELQEYIAKFSGPAPDGVQAMSGHSPDTVGKLSDTGLGLGLGKPSSSEAIASDQPSTKTRPPKVLSPVEVELAGLLRQRILENNPNAKITDAQVQKWAIEADRMIVLDRRTPAMIREVIEFSQADIFWRANILSMGKLREKFDQLWLKHSGGAKPAPVPMQPKRRAEVTDADRKVYENFGVSL